MPSDKKLAGILLALTGLFTLIIGVYTFIHPPAIYPDPAWGFHVMRSIQTGAPFNTLISPDTVDLSRNSAVFLSWWSPGQYLVPWFFIIVFNLSLGQSTAVVAVLCSLSGLAGLHTLFRKIGFKPLASAISIAFIASQQAYFTPFIFYNGGEILLFASLGWFLCGCTYFTKANEVVVVFILLSGLVGFFCKSSFLWIFLAGGLFLWVRLSNGKKSKAWLINGLIIGLPALISLAIIQFAYLSKGDNPASGSLGIKLTWQTFSFPVASPLLSGFSIDDLADGITNHPVIITLLLALISLAIVIYICKTNPHKNYSLLLCICYITAVLFYGINFLRQADISYEARHMRLIGLLITPGIIYILGRINHLYRAIFGLIWLFILYNSYNFTAEGADRNRHAALGNTGLAQMSIDQPMLNTIMHLDKTRSNTLFVFISNDIGLEIKNNRIINFNPIDDNLNIENIRIYQGYGGPIYMVLPNDYRGAKAAIYLKYFPAYHHSLIHKINSDYLLYQLSK